MNINTQPGIINDRKSKDITFVENNGMQQILQRDKLVLVQQGHQVMYF